MFSYCFFKGFCPKLQFILLAQWEKKWANKAIRIKVHVLVVQGGKAGGGGSAAARLSFQGVHLGHKVAVGQLNGKVLKVLGVHGENGIVTVVEFNKVLNN